MAELLITNVTIFDGSGREPFAGEVHIAGNRIKAVAEAPNKLPRDAISVLDGQGGTLLPGLVEPHGHPTFPDASSRTDFIRLPPEEHTLVTMRNARTMLDCGYTGVLSAASAKPRLDVVIRNAINAGEIPGPRLLANTPEITVTSGLGDANLLHLPHQVDSGFTWVADGPDEIRKACRLFVREGVDLFKLNISGDQSTPSAQAEQTVMSEAEVMAAMEVARAHDRRVCAHARSIGSVKLCLRHGIDIIYHSNHTSPETLDALEAAKDRVFVVPTLGHTYNQVHGSEFAPPFKLPGAAVELEAGIESMGALHKRGVRVLPGGDYGFNFNPHGTYARDLKLFVEVLGFTPSETLVAATRMGGEIMGMGDELGQIRPGYLADLLVVRGNPVQDIRLLLEQENLLVIMKDGELHKGPHPTPAEALRAAG